MTERTWSDYDAVACCEGFDGLDHDEAETLSAWQHLIDTGLDWRLQGSFGRTAARLIEAGHCTAPATRQANDGEQVDA